MAEVKTIILEPRSSALITLWLRPQRHGTLHIKGVRWRLQGNPRKVGSKHKEMGTAVDPVASSVRSHPSPHPSTHPIDHRNDSTENTPHHFIIPTLLCTVAPARQVAIRGRYEFNLAGKLRQDTRANRALRKRIPDLRCQMNVQDNQPWLGVSMPDAPKVVPRGAVVVRTR